MEIKLNRRELEFFYMGLLLGKELDIVEEWRNKENVGFGDFEGTQINLCLTTLTLDFDHFGGDDYWKYYACKGIAHEASERVEDWLHTYKESLAAES